MPMKIVKFYLIPLISCAVTLLNAQDAPISQYYNNLPSINPAFVGTSNGARINSFYRQQWPLLDSKLETYGVSYDQTIVKYKSGFGLFVSNDISGAVSSPSIEIAYAYHVDVRPGFSLSMGLQGGIVQKYINRSELIFEDEMNGGTTLENINTGFNKIYPDFSVGVVGFYKKIYAGLSVDHLNRPKTDQQGSAFSEINMKFTGQVGYIAHLKKRLIKQTRILMPSIMVQIQGQQQNICWGIVYQYDYLFGGLLVRHNISSNIDVLIISAGIKTNSMRFAYSYDMNVGKKSITPIGAHEISLTLLFNIHIKKKHKALNCPYFLR